ncbi:AraC family transcriptional regulator [Lysinibacillus sp. CTST325]
MTSHHFKPLLLENGFSKFDQMSKYNSVGTTYTIDPTLGKGYYWIYHYKEMFSILIHDFYFFEDYQLELTMPELLTVSYYESISGEELNPYQQLKPGYIRSYWGKGEKYSAIIHKNIPVQSIGIEFTPIFCDQFLAHKYGEKYVNPRQALTTLKATTTFPEMVILLRQIAAYRGADLTSALFYEGKVYEALALIMERVLFNETCHCSQISKEDIHQIEHVATHIEKYYALQLTLDHLTKISCMGATKLKKLFKEVYHCTITEYIQKQRVHQAEKLLAHTELPINEIARTVGYQSAGRFSELFKRYADLTPKEYRQQIFRG